MSLRHPRFLLSLHPGLTSRLILNQEPGGGSRSVVLGPVSCCLEEDPPPRTVSSVANALQRPNGPGPQLRALCTQIQAPFSFQLSEP